VPTEEKNSEDEVSDSLDVLEKSWPEKIVNRVTQMVFSHVVLYSFTVKAIFGLSGRLLYKTYNTTGATTS
jgi:hypothetical protein